MRLPWLYLPDYVFGSTIDPAVAELVIERNRQFFRWKLTNQLASLCIHHLDDHAFVPGSTLNSDSGLTAAWPG